MRNINLRPLLHLGRFAAGIGTSHQLLDCNITHNWQVLIKIEIKYLVQGHKHTGWGAWTHNIDGLMIMSPEHFR